MAKKNSAKNPKRKLAPLDGPDGVDRWTSNGYGLILNGERVEPIAETRKKAKKNIDEIEEA